MADTILQSIYNKVYDEIKRSVSRDNVYRLLYQKINNINELNDMTVTEVIMGSYTAAHITGGVQQSLKLCKYIRSKLHTYNLINTSTVTAILFHYLYPFYLAKKKPGKAHSAMTAAQWCMQHHAPSHWTALVWEIQARYHDRQAHIQPALRAKHQDKAMSCYTNARDHCLHMNCEGEDYVRLIDYTLDMLHITLDIPTLETIINFCHTDIVYNRLTSSVVSQAQIPRAQHILDTVIAEVSSSGGYKRALTEIMLTPTVFLHIRQAQLCLQSNIIVDAKSNIETAIETYDDWCKQYKSDNYSQLQRWPKLSQNMKQVIDNLQEEVNMKIDILFRSKLSKPRHVTSSPSPSSEAENTDDELTKLGQMKVNKNSDMDSEVMDIRDHHSTTSSSLSSETEVIKVNTIIAVESKTFASVSSESEDISDAINTIC